MALRSLFKATLAAPKYQVLSASVRQKSFWEQLFTSYDDLEVYYEKVYNDPNIDDFWIRKNINDMHQMDMIPEPRIMIACLKACRRLNDHSLAVRYLESVKFKCGKDMKKLWAYLVQEITPTVKELGISLPVEMGYDKPELAIQDYDLMH